MNQGNVEVITVSSEGRREVIATLKEGNVFGEIRSVLTEVLIEGNLGVKRHLAVTNVSNHWYLLH